MSESVLDRLNAALQGRYVVERETGEGGMAVVYLATDLKHHRRVALKVLKRELSAVVGGQRFLAEIAVTANLQHPHILPLFDSGEADGFLFYVMPFIEGESLADRLAREKQLPVDEAVRIASAVASALDHAHRHGVIHRDIKPGNILLQDGEPLVSDFGIALAVGAAGGTRLTETGLSLGTPFYMSPEQATGDRAVSPASDTYSLGCVLYEMLVGEPPYPGSTAQAVLGRIIQGEPVSAASLRKSIPPHVDAAIRKALETLPADRFTSAQDFARALADESFRHGGVPGAAGLAAARRTQWLGLAGWGVAVVLAVALAVMVSRPKPPAQVGRFAIPRQDRAAFTGWGRILPDGSGMIWRAGGPPARLWVRHWDEAAGVPVTGTEGAVQRGINASPDGTEVAFSVGAPGPLRVASLLGGPVRTIADSSIGGGVWSADGDFLYYADGNRGISRVPSAGGDRTVVVPGRPDSTWAPLAMVPGRSMLLAGHRAAGRPESVGEIEGVDLKTGETRPIIEGNGPAWVSGGRIEFGTPVGRLLAAPLDLDAMRVTGDATVVLEGVETNILADLEATVSADGTLLYLPSSDKLVTPAWVDRRGRASVIAADWRFRGDSIFGSLALSPNGKRVALSRDEDGWDIWVRDLDQGPLTRFTFGDAINMRPSWSADGQALFFLSNRNGNFDLWTRPADGSGDPVPVLDRKQPLIEAFQAPDGAVVFRTGSPVLGSEDADIFTMKPGRDTTVTTLVDSDFLDWEPALSPGGRWLAYASNESGRFQVYVRPFPASRSPRVQVSIDGGTEPVWSRDGTELFFRGPMDYVAAAVTTTPTFSVVGRTSMFPVDRFMSGYGHPMYDVSPDGKRFFMLLVSGVKPSPLILVKNWMNEVEGRLGR